ncbi:Exonuclease III [Zhouia amylolytica]|uniref:Exonuclease III n=1 Tax=Zhouia amylolytica TaxID=376730 RepID=A0A1I6UFJ0_9FLAO|nr:endonuclease/exonuclease/phosphatase family protein [Zhouia amylolytica]SFT00192.1 Exonuclease III [Zhouia amylolytica]
MKKLHLVILALAFSLSGCKDKNEPNTFKVMAWNILHGGNDIENGPENVIQIIKEVNPDVILMVETYGSGKKVADALGYNFHLIAPEGTSEDDKGINLSIISRYPFGDRIDTEHPFYLGGREVFVDKYKVRFFTNWFHYLPWHDQPHEMGKTAEELLEWERTETKFKMIQKVLPYLETYASQTDSIPMIFGGDMNTPSHLDWGENTKEIHNGLVVPWYATKVLESIGLKDTYRMLNTDPIQNPGITWDVKDKKDEHRIDYIFYKGAKLTPISSGSYKAFLNEPFQINNKTIRYPSDHGFVVTTFKIN